MWLETPAGERFGDLRIREAQGAAVEWLATACPFCVLCLEDSAKVLGAERLKVVDVTELAVRALGQVVPPHPALSPQGGEDKGEGAPVREAP
jgi:Fe-S oxidoreductase